VGTQCIHSGRRGQYRHRVRQTSRNGPGNVHRAAHAVVPRKWMPPGPRCGRRSSRRRLALQHLLWGRSGHRGSRRWDSADRCASRQPAGPCWLPRGEALNVLWIPSRRNVVSTHVRQEGDVRRAGRGGSEGLVPAKSR
jgi:hypothetical protein